MKVSVTARHFDPVYADIQRIRSFPPHVPEFPQMKYLVNDHNLGRALGKELREFPDGH